MRKFISTILLLTMILALCSCNANSAPNGSESSTTPGTNTVDPGTDTTDPGTDTTNPSTNTTDPGADTTDPGNNTGEPAEIDKAYMLSIIDRIYNAAEGSVYKGYYLGEHRDEMIKQGNISEKGSSRYFGVSLEFIAAVYSEANQKAVAYSMCLLRANDDANIEQIKTAIKDNANPNKWECVTAEKVIVESNGKYVILIMADSAEAEALKAAFLSLNLD